MCVAFYSPLLHASRVPTEDELTEASLDICFHLLDRFKTACGRYLTTAEGLDALRSPSSSLHCQSTILDLGSGLDLVEHNRTPIKYSSDGRTFRIESSHGYFVTEGSLEHGPHHHHWENSDGGVKYPPFGFHSWRSFYFEVFWILVFFLLLFARRKLIPNIRPPFFSIFEIGTIV
jgi:hypothetical protein